MTVTETERLVRRITDALREQGPESLAAKLAQDYADTCRTVNHRLEQCAAMIDAGDELQALQLAEAPPSLMDLLTLLSFREAGDWRAYCQKHNLPAAEPFYDKSVRQLNEAYGKGIGSDHQFYRDYRRAVMRGNDDQALSILRVIVRLNPADANASTEVRRIQDKLVNARLARLQEAVQAGDLPAVQQRIAEIEARDLEVSPAHPVWRQAQLLRCQALLQDIRRLRKKGAWQEAEPILEQVRKFAGQYELRVGEGDAQAFADAEEWVASQRRAFAEEQDFRYALEALQHAVATGETQRRAGRGQGLAKTQQEFEALQKRRQALLQFGRDTDPDLEARCQALSGWLQGRIRAKVRFRRAAWSVALALVGTGAAVASVLFLDTKRVEQLTAALKRLEAGRRVAEMQQTLRSIKNEKMRVRLAPALIAAQNSAERFVAQEMKWKGEFDQAAGLLGDIAAHGFTNPLAQVQALWNAATNRLAKLAPEFITSAQKQCNDLLEKLQFEHNAVFRTNLLVAERLATNDLAAALGLATVKTNLALLREQVQKLDELGKGPIRLEDAFPERLARVKEEMLTSERKVADWEKTVEALRAPATLEAYLEALRNFQKSEFAPPAHAHSAADLTALTVTPLALETALLKLDNTNAELAFSFVVRSPHADGVFIPDEISDEVRRRFVQLRDDPNLQNILVYLLERNPEYAHNPAQTHVVFVRGLLRTNKMGQPEGLIYDPSGSAEAADELAFAREAVRSFNYRLPLKRLGFARESLAFTLLGLDKLIDEQGRYGCSILQLLDKLNEDRECSAVFRAYLSLRLFEMADAQPVEWGMAFCPAAAAHRRRLCELKAERIRSGDWMVPKRTNELERPLAGCLAQAAQACSFEKQAKFLYRLLKQTHAAGFAFAGYVDGAGQVVTNAAQPGRGECWGWSAAKKPALLYRLTASGPQKVNEPLRFTPLFFFNGDRRNLLQEAARGAGYTPDSETGRSLLPPFFNDLP